MATPAEALDRASNLVAQAITELASLGADAPVAARDALTYLGSAYSTLGSANLETPYFVRSDEGDGGA